MKVSPGPSPWRGAAGVSVDARARKGAGAGIDTGAWKDDADDVADEMEGPAAIRYEPPPTLMIEREPNTAPTDPA